MAASSDAKSSSTKSLAADLFQDMGKRVNGLERPGDAEQDQQPIEEIESLCMNCHGNGITKFLLTRIPYFREIVISSFACEHCHFSNSEVQSAGEIQPRGSKFVFRLESEADLQRQVVKGDTSTFSIEDIDLEIPPGKGRFTNLEGIISDVERDLESHQDARMEQMPEVAQKVAGVIAKLQDMLQGRAFPFSVSVDDPSGNSWIEPAFTDGSGKYRKDEYNRTTQQNALLGIGDDAPQTEPLRPEYKAKDLIGSDAIEERKGNNVDDEDVVENQVYSFPATCPGCTRPCDTNMKMVNIPFFKQVILMSTTCELCGYRSNEVKTGGEVPEKGQRLTLKVDNVQDLSRDVLKSESAALSCPELDLHVEPGTLGGRFTTVEGLLTQISTDLKRQVYGLAYADPQPTDEQNADSMPADTKQTWISFFAKLDDAIAGKIKFTLVLQDPMAGSYVQSHTAPAKDPKIELEEYDRTDQEEEDLGLKDIKTEGYEKDV